MDSMSKKSIPISLFDTESAERIFEEVRKAGVKAVAKDGQPVCILLSPEEYTYLIDEIEDAQLLAVATERLAHLNPDTLLTEDEVNERLGITEEELEGYEEIEIE